jgi:type VI secretion system secreted protein Hcp
VENLRARWLRNLTAVVSIAVTLAAPSTAMADLITLKLPGIPGDVSGVKGLEGTIEVLSLSGNVQETVSGGSIGTGRFSGTPVFSDIVIQKRFDGSSPALFLALAMGRPLANGVITFLQNTTGGGFTKFFTITLSNVLLTKIATDASEKEVLAGKQQINLNYSRIELKDEVTGQRACWDLRTASSC